MAQSQTLNDVCECLFLQDCLVLCSLTNDIEKPPKDDILLCWTCAILMRFAGDSKKTNFTKIADFHGRPKYPCPSRLEKLVDYSRQFIQSI